MASPLARAPVTDRVRSASLGAAATCVGWPSAAVRAAVSERPVLVAVLVDEPVAVVIDAVADLCDAGVDVLRGLVTVVASAEAVAVTVPGTRGEEEQWQKSKHGGA